MYAYGCVVVKERICLPCQPTNSPPSPGDRNRCITWGNSWNRLHACAIFFHCYGSLPKINLFTYHTGRQTFRAPTCIGVFEDHSWELEPTMFNKSFIGFIKLSKTSKLFAILEKSQNFATITYCSWRNYKTFPSKSGLKIAYSWC